jgi:hypothetical protein
VLESAVSGLSEEQLAAYPDIPITVDITDLLLHLTFHERNISWPKADALAACRQVLESAVSGLSEEQLAAYPDIPITEELFMRLPLWDDQVLAQLRDEQAGEQAEGVKSWIFRVLLYFQDEAKPALLSDARRLQSATISARRLFAYLGVSDTPMAGFELALKLMISPIPFKTSKDGETAEGERSPEILVQHLWRVLFCSQSRPCSAIAPPPRLDDFCMELVPPEEPEPVVDTKAKPGKGAPGPEAEEEKAPPPLPEEMTVSLNDELVRNKAVLRGLCTHGALFCRRRALSVLFPAAAGSVPLVLHDTAQAAAAKGLSSLVPTPPPSAPAEPEVQE